MVKTTQTTSRSGLEKNSRGPVLHPSCSTMHVRHTLPKLSIRGILQLVERYQELQRITNSSQSMSCEMGWMKHPQESHGHNKHKPGKSPAFAPQMPALPTLLAVTKPCCTSNVKNSRGSSIAPNPDPLPGAPQKPHHPRVALRCNGEKPGSRSGQHKLA